MRAFIPVVFALTLAITSANSLLNEHFVAEELIGSHFGIPGLDGTYDYVILGGGTAGLALAYRLAEDARFTGAGVEAGDFYEFANGNYSEIPAFASAFIFDPSEKNPRLDWYQYTEPQPVCPD